MSPQAVRLLASAAVAGGVCWIALAITSLLRGSTSADQAVELTSTVDYLSFGIFAAALALTLPGLIALHVHQRGADGRLGRIGLLVALAGAGAQCVVISTIVATGEEPSWFGVAAPAAIGTWFVGSIMFAIALRRAKVMPGWVGPVLPVVTLLAIVGSEAGTSVLIGAFLIVVCGRIAAAASATGGGPVRHSLGKAVEG